MLKQSSLLKFSPILLAVAFTVALGTQSALATKLTGAPLPYERETKEFNDSNAVAIPPSGSRFQRRLDYREEEKLKKQQEAEAAKKAEIDKLRAIEEQKKAAAQQVENAKQFIQTAIDANNSAVAFGKQGRWNEAIVAHEKAVQYDPSNKQFKINLSAARTAYGQQRLAAHDYAGAAHLFRQALAAASDNAMAAKHLSEALKKQGIDPGSVDQRLELAEKLMGSGDLVGASIEIQQCMALEQSARVYQKMGDLCVRYGQVTNAMAYYRQAIVKDADYGPAHRQLAFLQMSKNDFTAAAASLRKAIICDSKDVAAGQALVELWRKQVAQNPLLAENHLGLAGAMQLTGDFVGAEGEYRRLEALDPRNPGLESGRASLKRAYQHAIAEKHRMAAETLFSQGLRREALGEINQAVMMEDKNPKYLYLMAECLEGIGNYAAAHAAYLKVVIIDPTKVEAAERAKEMQKNMGMSGAQVAQMSGQIANQITAQPAQQQPMQQAPQQMQTAQQQLQQQQFAAQPPGSFRVAQPEEQVQQQMQQHDPSRKSMYEGGSQRPAFNPQAMNFRTHDESQQAQAQMEQEMQQQARQQAMQAQQAQAQQAQAQQAQAQQQAAQTAAQANGAPVSTNDALSQVSVLESQRDYQGAATLLRQMCDADVQNPELHHRLATNLLNLGQVVEAIPEFRIASALKPAMKAYSDDLARAMAIHKRSLMSDKSDSSVSGSK